jgi:hypothetical protein
MGNQSSRDVRVISRLPGQAALDPARASELLNLAFDYFTRYFTVSRGLCEPSFAPSLDAIFDTREKNEHTDDTKRN